MLVRMSDVTRLLDAAAAGEPHVAADLLPLVYAELRKLAAARLAGEKAGHTLQPTALVHEAYLRLVGGDRSSSPVGARGTCSAPWIRPPAALDGASLEMWESPMAAALSSDSSPSRLRPQTRYSGRENPMHPSAGTGRGT